MAVKIVVQVEARGIVREHPFTLSEKNAEIFLDGGDLKANFGGYDGAFIPKFGVKPEVYE